MRTIGIGTLEVSEIGLGCNNFGRSIDAAESERVVRAALDAGVTFFDVASNYGHGRAESMLAAGLGRHRDEVVIATKFGMSVAGLPDSGGASPASIRRIVERSLTELGSDFIDLYQLHLPDPDTPIEDTLAVLDDLVQRGIVRQIGCSNLDTDQLGEALDASGANDREAFVSNQVHYSLVNREPETSGLIDLCAARGVAVLPYHPLASGLLTGTTRRNAEPRGRLATDRYRDFLRDENFDVAEAVEGFAGEHGVDMTTVAIGWLLAQDAVPAVTPGASNPDQVVRNVAAASWQPTSEDLATLQEAVTAAIGRSPASRGPTTRRPSRPAG
jgi:aryl-alcohol dehydrogenase-like predicted oxidoreductase